MIGIDARSIEKEKTGVGRYLWNLLCLWPDYFKKEAILYIKGDKIKDYQQIKSEYFKIKILKTKSNFLFQHFYLPIAANKDKIFLLFSPGYLLPVFYKGKTVVAIHDIIYQARPDLFNWNSFIDRFLLGYLGKKSARKADLILTSSDFSRNEIIKRYSVPKNKVKTVLLGVEDKFKKFCSLKQITATTEKYQIEQPYILFVGSIFSRRFPLEMLHAYENIIRIKPELNFLLLGKNLTKPRLLIDETIREINRNGGKIKRFDYGEEEDLPCLYKGAELFIWLSQYEGFGLPPLEAMASGVPVISSPFGSLPEILDNAALWVKNPFKFENIELAMKKILLKKELKKELSNNGLIRANQFHWESTAKKTNELFQQLLES